MKNQKQYKLVLASNSPRRRELLAGLGLPFEVRVKSNIDESCPSELPAEEVPEYLSMKKASFYELSEDELLITADTLVLLDGQMLGKPKDALGAQTMLKMLSGRTHQVVTGVCLKTREAVRHFSVCTQVTFKSLTDEEINYYVSACKPFDKAGAYGIQEWIGYIGVTGIEGSYFNVMGLPVQRVYEEFKKLKVSLF